MRGVDRRIVRVVVKKRTPYKAHIQIRGIKNQTIDVFTVFFLESSFPKKRIADYVFIILRSFGLSLTYISCHLHSIILNLQLAKG